MATLFSSAEESCSFISEPPPEPGLQPSSPLAAASAAVVADAAHLPQNVLKRGLNSGSAGLISSVPTLSTFVEALSSSAASNGEKAENILALTVKSFRCKRAQVMRNANNSPATTRRKSPGNISKEASIAGGFFERQIGIALLEKMVPDVLEAANSCVLLFGRLPNDTIKDLVVYGALQSHGVAIMQDQWEEQAERHAQTVKEKTIHKMVTAGRGSKVDARVRNNAASRKSDEKKKRLCELTRLQVHHVLLVRESLKTGMFQFGLEEAYDVSPVMATLAG